MSIPNPNTSGETSPSKVVLDDTTIPTPTIVPPTGEANGEVPPAIDPTNVAPITEPVELIEGTVVTVEDVDYTIDADGNAIDADGTIFLTADKVKEAIAPDPIETPVDVNIAQLNELSTHIVEIEGVTPAFTPEYIIAREQAIVDQLTESISKEAVDNYLSANPDIAAMVKYKKDYGTIDGFANHVDYSKIDLSKLDENLKLSVIIDAEVNRGNTRERAEKIARLSQTDNTLDSDAKDALTFLATKQADKVTAIRVEQENQLKAYVDSYNKETGVSYDDNGTPTNLNVTGSVYDDVVKQGRIFNLNIPPQGIIIPKDGKQVLMSRQELFDYLSKPVYAEDGQLYSQADADLFAKLEDRKYRNLVALMAINGLESLVKAEANKKVVLKVKSQAAATANPAMGVPTQVAQGSTSKVVLD